MDDHQELVAAGAATVYEAAGRRGAFDPGIRPITATTAVGGRALPIVCGPRDNLAIHRGLAEAGPGEILVVDGSGLLVGYVGDIIAAAALARGVVGLVIDGGVRDTDALREMEFPVWARGTSILGTTKVVPGRSRGGAVCGGVSLAAGDFVIADLDGVVAVKQRDVVKVAKATRERLLIEENYRSRIASGELTVDFLGLP